MAGRTRAQRNKPHTQIGQKGKGTNRPKPPPTPGLPVGVGQFPKAPPQIPNFLPSTPNFERGQSLLNDRLSLAGSQYGMTTGMIQPQLQQSLARLDTDQALAGRRLDEDMANRGVYTSGFRPKLYQEQVVTPFGRQRQDLASNAAQAYASAGLQYGEAKLGAEQDMFNLYNDTAQETASQPYLGFGYGGYQVPNMPGPMLTTPNQGGRTRPNRNRNRNNRGGNRGRR